MSQSTLIKTALTGAMAAGLVAMSTVAVAGKPGMEKCMGVAKAGKNGGNFLPYIFVYNAYYARSLLKQ